jgi:hypothetical protein
VKQLALALTLLLAAACGGTVIEVDPVPDDYTEWYSVVATGAVPGHGDSYRIIYANDQARQRGNGISEYAPGSILVKEIYSREGDGPGSLRYLGVMRKLDPGLDIVPEGAELHFPNEVVSYGWLFTYLADDIDSDEEYRSSCWGDCHQAAPIDGAFLDYGAP